MSWIKERNARESLVILRALSEKCSELGGPVSRMLNAYAQHDFTILMSYELDYSIFEHNFGVDVTDAIYARQILALFQKSQFLKLSETWDKSYSAAKRFAEAEAKCRDTNKRFKQCASDPSKRGSDVSSVLYIAQRKIAAVLGLVPVLDEFSFAFGPGANTNVKSSHANPRIKLGVPLECSANLSPTVGEFLSETPHWAALHDLGLEEETFVVNVSVVPGKVIFVPKNAKTDRSISIEPILNGFFQKGVGSYLRDRLLRSGIDLRDQSRNQDLAYEGSISGELATIDLSMASDCLSNELVWNLLPYDWANLLDSLRTSRVNLPPVISESMLEEFGLSQPIGSTRAYELQKFSSMGNGYTFELESLIFYAICYATCTYLQIDVSKVGVYGDDLIVPTGAADLLVMVLDHCGFSTNKEKSFVSGPFRESCGADYLRGFDIRPFYHKTLISDRNLFTMHNWFLRHGEFELAQIAKSFVHPHLALYGPDGFGDGHLIGSHELRVNRTSKRSGWGGGYFDTYVLKAMSYNKPSPGDAVLPVYSVYTRSGEINPTDPDIIRGSSGYAKVSIYTLGRSIFSRKL